MYDRHYCLDKDTLLHSIKALYGSASHLRSVDVSLVLLIICVKRPYSSVIQTETSGREILTESQPHGHSQFCGPLSFLIFGFYGTFQVLFFVNS